MYLIACLSLRQICAVHALKWALKCPNYIMSDYIFQFAHTSHFSYLTLLWQAMQVCRFHIETQAQYL